MTARAFIVEWGEFNKELRAQKLAKALDPQACVALFDIWYKEGAEKRRTDSMGLPNMMEMLQGMLKGTTEQIDRVNKDAEKDEDWRGDEH